MARVKYLPIKVRRLSDQFPNFHKSGSIVGIKP
jgi:hypothetical protein